MSVGRMASFMASEAGEGRLGWRLPEVVVVREVGVGRGLGFGLAGDFEVSEANMERNLVTSSSGDSLWDWAGGGGWAAGAWPSGGDGGVAVGVDVEEALALCQNQPIVTDRIDC